MHGFITQMVPPCDQILRNFVQILLTVENICEGGLFIYLYRINYYIIQEKFQEISNSRILMLRKFRYPYSARKW